jgi:hypothetical protein
MNRFSVCEAYWLYYVHWHVNGFTRRCSVYPPGIAMQLDRMRFRPSPLLRFDSMRDDDREDVRDAYVALVRRWEGDSAADRELESLEETA